MNFTIKITKSILLIIIVYSLTLVFTSCSKKNYTNLPAYKFVSSDGKPDYNNLSYWAAHPWKWDPSDSISKSLAKNYFQDSTVDVFFLHPTTLISNGDQRLNATIDDAALNAKTDYSAILYQASVFNENCRVFAPRYRQAHYRAFFMNDSLSANAFDLAYADVKNAFQLYLKNWNNGRPIIIAAHSQGTVHAARLIKEFFEGSNLKNKLVCTYLIGMPIKENYFTEMPVCTDSSSTGCYVSWRTFKNGYIEPHYIANEKFKCIVVNPLTWSTDNCIAGRCLNTGGILKNFNKLKPGVVNATIHNNILWASKPKFFGNIFLRNKNYHIGDINLFYNNIRQNVRTRINAFWKK
ncbi:MAG: DUF3089 domain-containing protein [Bacteroidota bacterium]